jgi:hypothetical protein
MTSKIWEVEVNLIKSIDWNLLANLARILSYFGAFLIGASTLQMRVSGRHMQIRPNRFLSHLSSNGIMISLLSDALV